MPNIESQQQDLPRCSEKQELNYNEIISYLDQNWTKPIPGAIQKIDALLGSIASTIPAIIISGTNGKSTTIYYLTKLFQKKNMVVGSATSPHFDLYNERILINSAMIPHAIFTRLANEVLHLIKKHTIPASSKDIVTAISLLHFKNEHVDVVLVEQESLIQYDPATIFKPQVLAITRLVLPDHEITSKAIDNLLSIISEKSYVISADQSKSVLQKIAHKTKAINAQWVMPIRKIAPLPYPYEQLHGRCAALAERIAQTYMNAATQNENVFQLSVALDKKRERVNPAIFATKEKHPRKEIELFWKELEPQFSNRFSYTEQKKYTLVLDNASNIDALENLLLGVRLLNYKKPFKSITFLFGCYEEQFCRYEFIKTIRYFFKKTSGQLSFCPISNSVGEQTEQSCDIEKIAALAQHAKIKISTYKSFKNAYETITKGLHDSQDLLVITGSQSIISEYLKYKKQ